MCSLVNTHQTSSVCPFGAKMAANMRGANTRRKHLSKNKKKSWRKVNIDDVEDFLEDERLQERTGGIVSEKADDKLFFVDKKKKDPQTAQDRKRQRKRRAQEKLKKLEVVLQAPPPKPKDKRCSQVLEKLASGRKSLRQIEAEKHRKQAQIDKWRQRKAAMRSGGVGYDLWGDTLESKDSNIDPHFLKTTRRTRVQVPSHHADPVSKVPAVDLPHPGASYNPAYDDHQELLSKAHAAEVVRLTEEERLRRSLDAKFPAADKAPTEASFLQEMSAGLFEEEEAGQVEGASDLDNISVNPPVRRENKKDEKQRKKDKERSKKEKAKEEEKTAKKKEIEFFRLKTIRSELRKQDDKLAARAAKKQQVRAGHLYRTRRLGKLKYEDADEAVTLSEDLVGSLRELKPEGNLLFERFKSMQKRNIIEPRVRALRKRKYKEKFYEKRGHKEVTC